MCKRCVNTVTFSVMSHLNVNISFFASRPLIKFEGGAVTTAATTSPWKEFGRLAKDVLGWVQGDHTPKGDRMVISTLSPVWQEQGLRSLVFGDGLASL